MITPDFTGYGARLHVNGSAPIDGGELEEMVKTFMSKISLACVDAGVKLIGHIKCIVEVPGEGYLSCSVTNHEGRPRCQGSLSDSSRFEMVLNIMIYGLEMEKVERIVSDQVTSQFSGMGLSPRLEVVEREGGEGHEHHSHEGHAHEHHSH
ncbi:MAG: hypothetical protein ACLFPN_03865 [Methanomassiliicoccales archaeon]